MLRHTVENHSSEQDEVELSRRSFFGRLAIGAVLSMAVPGIARAEKSKSLKDDKKHRTTQPTRSAVRLPKQTSGKVSQKTKVSNKKAAINATRQKSSSGKHPTLHTSQLDKSHNARVRDVYSGKKQGTKGVIQHSGQNDLSHKRTLVQTVHREPVITAKRSLITADRGRIANHRSLAFQNPHTGDKLRVTYFEKGRYLNDALDEISYLLRDYRTGDVHTVDPELLDQLHDLKQMLGLSQHFDVICGYRSPITNAKLHAEHSGVANNSFHMYGRAVDIRIERLDLRRIHNAAIAMHRGGVGYYPGSNFIHLDTGTFRTWSL